VQALELTAHPQADQPLRGGPPVEGAVRFHQELILAVHPAKDGAAASQKDLLVTQHGPIPTLFPAVERLGRKQV
jgi:hypothetical protein